MKKLSEILTQQPRLQVPFLDRDDIPTGILSADQKMWRNAGILLLPNAIPQTDIARLSKDISLDAENPAYKAPRTVKDICLSRYCTKSIENFIGAQMALSWVGFNGTKTDELWGQYLHKHEPNSYGWSAVAIFPLEDGNFVELIPFSHKLGTIESTDFIEVDRVIKHALKQKEFQKDQIHLKKGDILFIHPRLIYRMIPKEKPESLVGFYSATSERGDYLDKHQFDNGSYYLRF